MTVTGLTSLRHWNAPRIELSNNRAVVEAWIWNACQTLDNIPVGVLSKYMGATDTLDWSDKAGVLAFVDRLEAEARIERASWALEGLTKAP